MRIDVVFDLRDGQWHSAYDCELGEEIIFRIIPRILPADNPQASETSSHIGLKGNRFCRRCVVGGPHTERESDEGYDALFQVRAISLTPLWMILTQVKF